MRTLITIAATLALSVTGFAQEAKTQIKKTNIEYTNPASGAEMFRTYCAACHGTDARGTGPAATALKKAPADLTLLSKKNGGKFPALSVQNTIKGEAGAPVHGSRDMPMWGDIFRSVSAGNEVVSMRVSNLTEYVKSIQQN